MEDNLSNTSMVPIVPSNDALSLQRSTAPINLLQRNDLHGLELSNHLLQGSKIPSPICDKSPLTTGEIQMNSIGGCSKVASIEEEDAKLNEEGADVVKGNSTCNWQRVKWSNFMIKFLITTVSYMDDDVASPMGRNLQKKGKWRTVSKVMSERGLFVSPQQCEDKFNDLNKRYKKLNDILGRGTSCEVVENPVLLDMMDHISDKAKDEVRKILSSKHLFYEQMCSYHNRNRLFLPHDPTIQRAVQLALCDPSSQQSDDDHEGDEHELVRQGFVAGSTKRMKHGNMQEDLRDFALRKDRIKMQFFELEQQKLELDKQRVKWERLSRKRDRKLEKMKMENERMRIENEQMAMEMKHMEMRAMNFPS